MVLGQFLPPLRHSSLISPPFSLWLKLSHVQCARLCLETEMNGIHQLVYSGTLQLIRRPPLRKPGADKPSHMYEAAQLASRLSTLLGILPALLVWAALIAEGFFHAKRDIF